MNRASFSARATRLLVVADIIVFSVALAASLFIRAQFTNFLVSPIDIAALVPLTILLRLFTNVVFEHYSLGGTTFLFRDFTALSLHNLVATAVLLALRFFAQVKYFRLPISAIFIEYVFSTFGMIMVRLLIFRLVTAGGSNGPRYRPRILVWGEVGELTRSGELNGLLQRPDIVVKGILTSNVVFWDSHHLGLRVFGDESSLSDVLRNDDAISAVLVPHPEQVTRRRLRAVARAAKAHGMMIQTLNDGAMHNVEEAELLAMSDLREDPQSG